MRHLLAVLAMSLAAPALADEPLAVSIDATTTSKTNAQATTPGPGSSPYRLGDGLCYAVQCVGADVYVKTVSTSTGTVSSSNFDKYLSDKVPWAFCVKQSRFWVAVKTVTGTATCQVVEQVQ